MAVGLSAGAQGLSDWMEGSILSFIKGAVLTTTAFNGATTIATSYVGLFTTQPADTGTFAAPADGTEVTTTSTLHLGYTNYARQPIAAANWSAIASASGSPAPTDTTGQMIQNSLQIAFPAINTTVDVIVSGVGLWDAATVGHLLYYVTLASPVTYVTGSVPTINALNLTCTLD